MKGRRVNSVAELEQPGDYYGPAKGYTGEGYAVFFLKPNSRDADAPELAKHIQHVAIPSHTVVEEADGTLTIQPSIGDTARDSTVSDGWHGFLEHGVWRKV